MEYSVATNELTKSSKRQTRNEGFLAAGNRRRSVRITGRHSPSGEQRLQKEKQIQHDVRNSRQVAEWGGSKSGVRMKPE